MSLALRSRAVLIFGVVAVGSLAVADQALAQFPDGPILSYAAKFVCGAARDSDVVAGGYLTAINVHNPHFQIIRFEKKAVLAGPERDVDDTGVHVGRIGKKRTEAIAPDGAFFVDCFDVAELLGMTRDEFFSTHREGFVVIEVLMSQLPPDPEITPNGPELDVVGKYTARPLNGQVSSIDIEVYKPKRTFRTTLNQP